MEEANHHPRIKRAVRRIRRMIRRRTRKTKRNKSEGRRWKEGSVSKILVLARSTTSTDLMKQAKSKLNMKKKPTRCFFVDDKTKLEVDLTTNLAGLADDSIVFVTSHTEIINDGGNGENKNDVEEVAAEDKDEVLDVPDPLESVKKAYTERRLRKSRKRRQDNKSKRTSKKQVGSIALEHPRFSDHFDKLEDLPPSRAALPAASFRTKVLSTLDSSRVVVICGATGCGKSTQLPQTILEGMDAAGRSDTHIIVTQPRRVAAMSLAERVASERNCPPPGAAGSVVGYNVRLSRRVSDEAKIVYCTVGILLRMLITPSEVDEEDLCPIAAGISEIGGGDSSGSAGLIKTAVPLSSVSHVIIDEVHERDLNTDFALTLLRPLLDKNKNIRVILMSATASPDLFVNYFRSSELEIEPIVLSIPGRTFPVTNHFLEECEKFANARLHGWSNSLVDKSDRSVRDIEAKGKNEKLVELSPRAGSRIDNSFICKLIVAIIAKQGEEGQLKKSNAQDFERRRSTPRIFAGKRRNRSAL